MKTVLLTGFEPFGGESVNPSGEIARQMHGKVIGGHRVTGALLPCVFGAAITELKKQIRATKPALVICVGQAGGRAEITPERVAINVDDARMPDNAGRQPVDRAIVRGGPAAYWSTLPIKAMVAALTRQGIPAKVSQTAGTFVCNHLFYGLMHELAKQRALRQGSGLAPRGGFIHVPWLPEQALRLGSRSTRSGSSTGRAKPDQQPSLPLETMTLAIGTAIAVALKTRRDLRVAGGASH